MRLIDDLGDDGEGEEGGDDEGDDEIEESEVTKALFEGFFDDEWVYFGVGEGLVEGDEELFHINYK